MRIATQRGRKSRVAAGRQAQMQVGQAGRWWTVHVPAQSQTVKEHTEVDSGKQYRAETGRRQKFSRACRQAIWLVGRPRWR